MEAVLSKAQTHAFTVLGMSQLVHAVGMRDVNKSVFRMKHLDNLYMLLALGAGVVLQMLVTEIPYFVALFGTSRLSISEWVMLGVLSLTPVAVHEILILSEYLSKKSTDGLLQKTAESKEHENDGSQPGEAA